MRSANTDVRCGKSARTAERRSPCMARNAIGCLLRRANRPLSTVTRQDRAVVSFSIGSIPVSVRPTFWLVALLLGWSLGDTTLLIAWVLIVFVSVLAHEMGHALTARRYGADVAITLTTFGGFTRWSMPERAMAPGRRALVAAAGSAVGIVLGLAVLGAFLITGPWPPLAGAIITMVVWVNVGWGVLNWLPIRLLDGGHLVMALLDLIAPRRAEGIAATVFIVTGLGAFAAALYYDLLFAALLAGFMTWAEIRRRLPARGEPHEPVEFSYDEPFEEPDHSAE